MYGCPNCGGMLRYDIPLNKMKCDHCDSTYDVKDLPDESLDQDEYETNVFICPQCGGEIQTMDNDMTACCSYCGNTQVLKSRVEKVQRPRWIIPFRKDKDLCKSLYFHAIKKAVFAPSELKDPAYMDKIQGVYMPYWFYECDYENTVALKGIKPGKMDREGDYVTVQRYEEEVALDVQYLSLQEDASNWYSDEISDEISPFSLKQTESSLQAFHPAFLCGFSGETVDTQAPPKAEYQKNEDQAVKMTKERVENHLRQDLMIEQGMDALKKPTRSGSELGLLPVWFLAYKKGNRVSYSVVNGQTGRFAAEFPIDLKKFFPATAALALLIFAILNLFWVMRPEYIAMMAAVGALWAIRLVRRDLREIARKEYETADPRVRKRYHKPSKDERKFGYHQLVPYALIIALILAENTGHIDRYPDGLMTWLPMILTIWTVIASFIDVYHIHETNQYLHLVYAKGFIGHLPAFLSILAALAVQILHPASDTLYFEIGFLCMVMTILSIGSLVLTYNRMATRSMPQFEHKGGDDSAKTEPKPQQVRASFIALLLISALLIPTRVHAVTGDTVPPQAATEALYTNPETGYSVKVIDDADLFSDRDEAEITQSLTGFTEYGNALAATAEVNDCSTVQKLAVKYYDIAFGTEQGAVLLIDMDDREIYWYTEGDLYDVLSVNSAMAITDNVYTYAGAGDYAGCASTAFEQAVTVMNGGRIAHNMKYYGNLLLAIILALFVNYMIARRTSFIRPGTGIDRKLYSERMNIKKVGSTLIGPEKRYRPQFKSASSGRHFGSSYSGSYGSSYSSSSSSGSYSSRSSSSSSSSGSYSSHSSSSSGSSHSSSSHSSSGHSSGGHRGGGAGHRF